MRVPRYTLRQSYASVTPDDAPKDTPLLRRQIPVPEIDCLIIQMVRH